jgi:hypothetical protein
MNSLIRTYLYIITGLISPLLGWNIAHIFLTDFGWLREYPELILFPCIAVSLSVGMVLTEIFISSPTRLKLNLRTAKIPILLAIGLGLGSGLIAGMISQILFFPALHIPSVIVRVIGWLLVGIFTGLSEGYTWRWRSIEAGNKERFQKRLKASFWGALAASLAAAILFEALRKVLGNLLPGLENFEDPVGFAILGMLLGFVFSRTSSPSYQVALRAGGGFEYTGPRMFDYGSEEEADLQYPSIKKGDSSLSFISDGDMNDDEIEEGLSIRLPSTGKIIIGSVPGKSNIYLPNVPPHIADLEFKPRETLLSPNPRCLAMIEVNGQTLDSKKSVALKHNYVITFHTADVYSNKGKFYRFVYYNRFLDPQA